MELHEDTFEFRWSPQTCILPTYCSPEWNSIYQNEWAAFTLLQDADLDEGGKGGEKPSEERDRLAELGSDPRAGDHDGHLSFQETYHAYTRLKRNVKS